MTVVDRILEELIKGTSLKEIRAKYKSSSSLTIAIRLYFPIADKILEMRDENSTLLKEEEVIRKDIEKLKQEQSDNEKIAKGLKQSIKDLQIPLEKVKKDLDSARA